MGYSVRIIYKRDTRCINEIQVTWKDFDCHKSRKLFIGDSRISRFSGVMKQLAWRVARWFSQRSTLLTSLVYNILFRFWEIQGRVPVVVFQMAKVGSSTVARSIKASRKFAVFQVHNLRTCDIEASLSSIVHRNQRVYSRVIWESRYLDKQIKQNKKSKTWNFITLVREPIARNVSAYFQNIEKWCPTISDTRLTQLERLELAQLAFFTNFQHNHPLTWLDDKLLPVVGIDVYQSQFPIKKGFEIYESGRFRLLLIRLENLKECYELAFYEFLGIRGLKLLQANVGFEKDYSELYAEFLKKVPFPPTYIDKMYNS